MESMTDRTKNETHLLDVFSRWNQMGPKERRVRLEQAVKAVLQEATLDGYRFDFHDSRGLRLFTPSGLILWFVPGAKEQRIEVFVVDAPVNPT